MVQPRPSARWLRRSLPMAAPSRCIRVPYEAISRFCRSGDNCHREKMMCPADLVNRASHRGKNATSVCDRGFALNTNNKERFIMSLFNLHTLPAYRFLSTIVAFTLCATLAGCGAGGTILDPAAQSTPPPLDASTIVTGNWQAQTTPASGTKSLGTFSGGIDQNGGNTSSGQFTTSVFRFGSPCFATVRAVPAQGFVNVRSVALNSFAVESQYINLTGTSANSGSTITGDYKIYGGCADGSSGGFTMNRYAPFAGTYVSSTGFSITTTQAAGADGSGAFPLNATGSFPGNTCFSKGTAMSQDLPAISGSSIYLVFTTDDRSGGKLLITGTISADASQVLSYQYSIQGGTCAGQAGNGSMQRR